MANTRGCFTNVLQDNLTKIYNAGSHIYGENFNLNICMYDQSVALNTGTKFQLEILRKGAISVIHKFDKSFWKGRETLVKQPPNSPNLYGRVHVWEGGAVLVFATQLEFSSLTYGFQLLK